MENRHGKTPGAVLMSLVAYYKTLDRGLTVTPEYEQQWIKSMSRFSPEALEKMVDHFREWEDKFPSVHRCVIVTDSIQQNIDLASKPKPEKPQWEKNDEYAHKCMSLINKILSGEISRGEYVKQCESLGHDMSPLKGYYAKFNLDMGKVPQMRRKTSL